MSSSSPSSLAVDEFLVLKENNNPIVLDTRSKEEFSSGFIPNAIFMGLDSDKLETWIRSLFAPGTEVVLVTEEGKEAEAVSKFSETGLRIIGFLKGGFKAWQDKKLPVDLLVDIEADEFAMDIPFDEKMVILDVRSMEEYESAHVKNAVNIPLPQFLDKAIISNLEEDENLYLYCGGGYRSLTAASILKKENYHNIRNIIGGFHAIKNQKNIPLKSEKTKNKEADNL